MGFSSQKNKFIKPISDLIDIKVTPNIDNYPEEMKDYRQWVCWSFIEKEDGSTAKSPVYINKYGQLGLAKWSIDHLKTFEDAVDLFESSDLIHGVGFVFTESDPFIFIDFDKLKPGDERHAWINRDTFAEWSQSGNGLHMIVKGKLNKAHKPTSGLVEIYSSGRFCAMTGKMAGKESSEIIEDQMMIDALIEAYPMSNSTPKRSSQSSSSFSLPDEIKEGTRNDTMWKYACSLNARLSDQQEIADLFIKTNKERVIPPLEDKIVEDMLERASNFVEESRLSTGRELVDNYVYIASDEVFMDKCTLVGYNKTNFNYINNSYRTDKGRLIANEVFMNHPEREIVDVQTWIPTGKNSATVDNAHIIEQQIHETDLRGVKKFNTWKGIPCVAKTGKVTLWNKLLQHLVVDSVEREVILDWLAAIVQHPEKKINWQIVHTGTHGCGKDSLYAPIGMILGLSAGVVTHEELLSTFTGYIAKKKFLILEEIFRPGSRDFDVSNKLKTLAASVAGSMMTINEKFTTPYTQADVLNFVILSNHDDCLYVEKGERRYFSIKSDVKPLPSDFYSKYYQWLNEERGYQAIYNFLLERDISDFDYAKIPFESSATTTLKNTSYMDYQMHLMDMIESETSPFDEDFVVLSKVKESLAVSGYSRATDKGITQVLKEKGFKDLKGVKKVGKKVTTTSRFWSDKNDVISMKPSELFDFFQKNKAKTV